MDVAAGVNSFSRKYLPSPPLNEERGGGGYNREIVRSLDTFWCAGIVS